MKILIADDHSLIRQTIADYIEAKTEIKVSLAETVEEACQIIDQDGPFDLVLIDYCMPEMNGLNALPRLLKLNDERPVAMMSGVAEKGVVERAVKIGAAGFVPKSIKASTMVLAIQLMIGGDVYLPADFHFGKESENLWGMTEREKDVLHGICKGKSNKEIARDLDRNEATIKMYVRSLTKKMQAKNRTHAAILAYEAGLN